MSTFLSTVCVVLSVTPLQAEIGTLTTVLISRNDTKSPVVKNKNFVDVIKESLRRNNDDYDNDSHIDKLKKPLVKTRRALNESEQVAAETIDPGADNQSPPSNSDTTEFRSYVKDVARKNKHEINNMSTRSFNSLNEKGNSKGSNNNDQRNMVDKWKSLIEKSNRLRRYTSSSKMEPSSAAKALRAHHAMRTLSIVTPMEESTTASSTTRPRPRQAPNVAMLPLRSPGPIRKPPNADQLDMAPARGAHINDLRLKNRFCYRHVLWPEGPKYNSKGETIMPAFDANLYHRRRKFFETIKPEYVLPRCCNCCKKSVLGCQ